MLNDLAVSTKNLSKEFEGKRVLKGFDINIKKGEIYGILGANGAGKTTLLKLISGLLEPSEGNAIVLGKDSWTERYEVLKNVGILIESPCFYEHLSAHENLSIHLAYTGVDADINLMLERVGLDYAGNKPTAKFSMGMRQRLAIARSLIHNPKILILDEPLNGLDPVAIRHMRELFLSLKNQGTTLLLSSHILSEVMQTAERISVISKGRLLIEEQTKELEEAHGQQLQDYLINLMIGGKVCLN